MSRFLLPIVLAMAMTETAAAHPHEALDDFAFSLHEVTGDFARPWVVTRFHTFHVGKRCLARFADKKQAVVGSAAQVAGHLLDYAKSCGADDWSTIESQRTNDRETNKRIVSDMIDAFRPRISITINVEGDDCDTGDRAMWLQYWTSIVQALDEYPPKGHSVAIVLNVTTKVKTMSGAIAKDGTLVFTAPRDIEPNAWGEPVESTFRRAAGK
jgi:hypothetical protein